MRHVAHEDARVGHRPGDAPLHRLRRAGRLRREAPRADDVLRADGHVGAAGQQVEQPAVGGSWNSQLVCRWACRGGRPTGRTASGGGQLEQPVCVQMGMSGQQANR